jgi:DNA-binding NarL/FixJ family response regulator
MQAQGYRILFPSENMTPKSAHKIMIVEGEAVIALKLQKMLPKMGYHVMGISHTSDDALEKIRHLRPDLILMAIKLPGKQDGIKVAKTVKSELNIPVIFLTALSDEITIDRAIKTEAYGYILKPFHDLEVRVAIEIALYRKEMEKKLRQTHDALEHRVKERTAELNETLETLKCSETELAHHKAVLERLNQELMDTNQALSVVATNIDKEKQKLEKEFFTLCSGKIIPKLKNLQKDVHCQKRRADLELMISYLKEAFNEPRQHKIIASYLSEQEMRVALMIKNGLSNQQIADMLYISPFTVKSHRKNIRKKFNIKDPRTNLVSYLKSRFDVD